MRFALITASQPDSPALRVIVPPGDAREVRDQFNELVARGGDGYASVQLVSSDSGVSKRKVFSDAEGAEVEESIPVEEGLEMLAKIDELTSERDALAKELAALKAAKPS